MKILIINYTDGGGGGAIAPKRLYDELKKHKIDVDFGVIEKKSEAKNVLVLKRARTLQIKIIEKLINLRTRFLFKNFKTTNGILHSANFISRIDVDKLNKSDYDIIHLHWIAGNTISVKDIGKINKPIIWTMHDSWPVCGAEHHPNLLENDSRYITGYTKENKPSSSKGFDICKLIFELKKKYFKMPIQFIAPSIWQKSICEHSFICKSLADSSVTHIPNLLNQNVFYQFEKITAKKIFNIPVGKTVLGFSTPYSSNPKTDMKGGGLLLKALKTFFEKHNPDDYICLLIGNINTEFKKQMPTVESIYTGFIQNENIMNLVYNACDVLLFPSKIENLPYGCLEPQVAGVPVTAFETGGVPDIVQHKKTGYLAKCFDTDDFSAGIEYCLEHKLELSKNAIQHITQNFDMEDAVNKHIELYKKVYNGHGR